MTTIKVGNKNIDVSADGFSRIVKDGIVRVFDPSGKQIIQETEAQYKNSGGQLNPLLKAAAAAFMGTILGPAGFGIANPALLAGAAGGLTTAATGGDLEDSLKAAALAAAAAGGTSGLLGGSQAANYDAAFAAADAAQLANQGFDVATIAQNLSTYVDPNTAISLAITANTQATALADAQQLLNNNIPVEQVASILESTGIPAEVATSVAEAAAEGVTQITATNIIPNLTFQPQTKQITVPSGPAEQVSVTGQSAPVANTGALSAVSPLLAEVVAPSNSRVVVSGSTVPTETSPAVEPLLTAVPAAVSPATATTQETKPTERVDVTAQRRADITSLYDKILGRLPDLAGLEFYSNPQFTLEQIEADIKNSAEARGKQSPEQTSGGLLSPTDKVTVSTTGVVPSAAVSPAVVPAATTGLLSGITESVPITGNTVPAPSTVPATTGAVVGTALTPAFTASTQPTDRVEVVERKPYEPDELDALVKPPVILPPAVDIPIPEVKITQPEKPLVSTSDLLKLFGLLTSGGAAAGLGAAGGGMMGVGSVPVSDTALGTTTPEFGPDYYAAVQQYYNAYMPASPRDVAGPLQQWYQNKYGA
jgi:hypothetical protein